MAYPDDVARVELKWTLPGGGSGVNVLHTRHPATNYTQPTVDEVADNFNDWYQNDNFGSETNEAFRKKLNANITLAEIVVTSLGAIPFQKQLAVGVAGTGAGNPVPRESAVVTTWYTALAGRSRRGRSFWAGASVLDMQNDGTLSTAAGAGWQDAMDALVAGFDAASSSEFVVHSKTLGDTEEITSAVVRDLFHHQRRRNQ
jgi:hypothetical protein